VTRPARPVVKQIANTCVALDRNATIAAVVVSQGCGSPTCTRLPWETEPWKSLIARNSLGNGEIGAPILITQGEVDRLILPSITKAFVDQLCRQGETVDYRTYPGVDHVHAGPETATDVANWIADRFAGKPPPNTC
jgi:dienelactone hydrolase